MDVGIRELEIAELAAVSGGDLASDIGKIGWGLTGGLIGGGVAAAGAALVYVVGNALLDSVSSCSQCGNNLGQPM